jgi:hypothetical protein
MQATPTDDYPATFTFDPPERVANWRPLVHWILVIPHVIVLMAVRVVSQVVAVLSWFAILFTGSLPASFANIQALYLRYEIRIYTYVEFMRPEWPTFAFEALPADSGEDPRVRVDFRPEYNDRNRLTTLFRAILVIPHLLVLVVLGFMAGLATIVAFFAVLFTGKWPAGLRDFVLNVARWYLRVEAYFLLLTDEYPPFALE